MAEVKSVKTNDEGVTKITIELVQKELADEVVKETVKLLAMGLGNKLISEHMDELSRLFTAQFNLVIGNLLEQTGKNLNRGE